MDVVETKRLAGDEYSTPTLAAAAMEPGIVFADTCSQADFHSEQNVYAIEKRQLGYKLVFEGSITPREMQQWLDDSILALREQPSSFGLLIDMRALQPLTLDSQRLMSMGHSLYQRRGLRRSVVVVESVGTRLRFAQLAKESGAYQWERYISAEDTPDWEARGWAWISGELDPDA
jgi:aryl carrier-like protein